jgi:hypothetical protein
LLDSFCGLNISANLAGRGERKVACGHRLEHSRSWFWKIIKKSLLIGRSSRRICTNYLPFAVDWCLLLCKASNYGDVAVHWRCDLSGPRKLPHMSVRRIGPDLSCPVTAQLAGSLPESIREMHIHAYNSAKRISEIRIS